MNPINPALLKQSADVRRSFSSEEPLPHFEVLQDFLGGSLLDSILAACRSARYSTFCSYSDKPAGRRVLNRFCEPRENGFHITVHQRPVPPIPELEQLAEFFNAPESLSAVRDLTGVNANGCDEGVLTCWGPETFLEQHTDYIQRRKHKLVLSLSLTERWSRSYGGTTVFAWNGSKHSVRVQPRLNTAVLFVPFSGSYHWVEQISPIAPPKLRLTWTLFFH